MSHTRARAVFALAALSACAACASGGGASPQVVQDPMAGTQAVTRIETNAGAAEIRTVHVPDEGLATPVPADADKAFSVLQGVYEGLGLKVNTLVSGTHVVGLRDGRAPRRVGGLPLSRLLECGTDVTGLANADAYAVTLTVLSRVDVVSPTSSVIQTQVVASARPRSISGTALRCGTSGRLEQAINDAVAERVRP